MLIISELRTEYSLKKLFSYTGMPKSTYYAAMKSINEDDKYSALKEAIKRICTDNKSRYGYRHVTLKLKSEGFEVNHKVVMKLMKQAGLACKARLKI